VLAAAMVMAGSALRIWAARYRAQKVAASLPFLVFNLSDMLISLHSSLLP
jgi:hypothetical protein